MNIKESIEEFIGLVKKPTRYIGNEWNSVHKDNQQRTTNDERLIRIALAFPDLYEIGMSHLGMNILYHLLNAQEDVFAERVYTPWIDIEENLRCNKIPLFSLETHTPLGEFDIIGFSLQYEMCYTNVLTILDLAGIPLFACDRDDTHPLIIAGGVCAFNPEPICEFIDLFVIGEAEEAILELVAKLQSCKVAKLKKQEILKEMAKIEGVYIPSFYEVHYNPSSTIDSVKPRYNDVRSRIRKRTINDINSVFCPAKPIVPFQSIIHDRAVLEVFRGCTQGCRFCHAGMTSRPVRMRNIDRLRGLVCDLMENTGWEEITLLALNICDYPDIEQLISEIVQKYRQKGVSISLPSLRPDKFSVHLAQLISMGSRVKPTLTFAPEAGTQRLRNIINKNVNQDEMTTSIGNAYRAGWDSCKLYFMLGLPQEVEEDIKGITELARQLRKVGQRINQKASIRLSTSAFVAKSHTPFQWETQEKIEYLREKQKRILMDLRKIEVRWNSPETSFLEGVLARGDRRLNKVILYAWEGGARFDAWKETFNFSVWERAFQKSAIDPSFYLYRKREYEEVFPWDHIDAGVSKEFLINENKRSKEALTTPNCLFEECQKCGACSKNSVKCPPLISTKSRCGGRQVPSAKQPPENTKNELSASNFQLPTEVRQRIRIKFSKGEEVRYTSHLDLQRVFIRALRRAEIPITFSKSFHPLPEVILGLPLSVGMTSDCELCDVFLSERIELDEFVRRLSSQLPRGLGLKESAEVFLSAPALPNIIKGASYNVVVVAEFTLPTGQNFNLGKRIKNFLNQSEIIVHRKTPKVDKILNIRPMIENIKILNVVAEFTLPENFSSVTFEISLKVTNESNTRPDEVIRSLLGPDAKIIEIKRTKIMY